MPATRATASASPLGKLAGAQEGHHVRGGADGGRGGGLACGHRFRGDVHHLRSAVVPEVRQAASVFCCPGSFIHSIHTSTSAPAVSSVTSPGIWTNALARARAWTRCDPAPPSIRRMPSPATVPRGGPGACRQGRKVVQPGVPSDTRRGAGVPMTVRQGRPEEHFEGDQAADWISGKSEKRNAIEGPQPLRPAWLHCHGEEINGLSGHRLAHHLVGALAHSPGGDNDVHGMVCLPGERVKDGQEFRGIVVGDARYEQHPGLPGSWTLQAAFHWSRKSCRP